MRSGGESSALLAALRQQLRQGGWTARKLAAHFAIGEATAKRWLAGRGLTLDRLETLSALCGLTLAELARAAEAPPAGLAGELTLAQERALSADIFLSFLFMTILGGNTPAEIARDFGVPQRDIDELAEQGIAYTPFFPLGGFSPLQSGALSAVARGLGATPMQVALVWLLRRSPNILLIPGTSSRAHLTENLAAAKLELPDHALVRLDRIGSATAE